MTRHLCALLPCLLTWLLPASSSTDPAPAPRIFLTFDDGPINDTLGVLDVLRKHDVKATFFINGYHLDGKGGEQEDRAGEALHRLIQEGHVVGNHSYDHMLHNNQPWRSSRIKVAAFRNAQDELPWFLPMNTNPTDRTLGDLAQYPNNRLANLVRLPYTNNWRLPDLSIDCPCCTADIEGPPGTAGRCEADQPAWSQSGSNSAALADELYAKGMLVFGWDLEWGPTDWSVADSNATLPRADTLIQQIEAVIHHDQCVTRRFAPSLACQAPPRQGKVIILTHDFLFDNNFRGQGADLNLPKLDALLQRLKESGYIFDTLDHYL